MNHKAIKGLIVASSLCALTFSLGIAGTFAFFSRQTAGTVHIKVGNINFEFDEASAAGTQAMVVENGGPGLDYSASFNLKNTGTVPFTTVVDVPEYAIVQESGEAATDEQMAEIKEYVGVHFIDDEEHVFALKDVDTDTLRFDLIHEGSAVLEPETELTFGLKVVLGPELSNAVQNLVIDFPVRLTCTQCVKE